MGKPKRSRDTNVLAFQVVQELTHDPDEGKDAKRVRAGRLGGKKGGTARATKLTPERRREIAQQAAKARWQSNEVQQAAISQTIDSSPSS
jgi:predicted transposase YdaD